VTGTRNGVVRRGWPGSQRPTSWQHPASSAPSETLDPHPLEARWTSARRTRVGSSHPVGATSDPAHGRAVPARNRSDRCLERTVIQAGSPEAALTCPAEMPQAEILCEPGLGTLLKSERNRRVVMGGESASEPRPKKQSRFARGYAPSRPVVARPRMAGRRQQNPAIGLDAPRLLRWPTRIPRHDRRGLREGSPGALRPDVAAAVRPHRFLPGPCPRPDRPLDRTRGQHLCTRPRGQAGSRHRCDRGAERC
jgi:hypothetical protein